MPNFETVAAAQAAEAEMTPVPEMDRTSVTGEARTAAASAAPADRAGPAVPQSIADTGLSRALVSDLVVKTLYVQGARLGSQLEDFLKLPFLLIDDELLDLQQRHLVEVRGAQGHGRRGYTFDLTDQGRGRGRELLQQNRYVGAAPVPLDQYWKSVQSQSSKELHFTRERIREGFQHLVFSEDFLEALGPAINSGRSLFLYGHAGNGKTALAEAISNLMGDAVYIPRAIEVDGAIIGLYDPVAHKELPPDKEEEAETAAYLRKPPAYDQRFVRIRRPVVMVGGELTLDQLELQLDAQTDVFRAPPQLKANGGVFVIDDFGRQRVRPRDLLNRWMIPLDRHMDYLSLPMGHKLPVPFDCLLIFATNLDPSELVEEAFLRRIQYKVLVDSPTREQYQAIWRRCCESRGLPFRTADVDYIWTKYYEGRGLPARACHPRDISNHLEDIARYRGMEPTTSRELLDAACDSYFLEEAVNGEDGDGPAMSASWMGGRFDG